MKVLHISDVHATNKDEKQDDIEKCGAFVLAHAEEVQPDLILLAGDTVDEYDGRINIDSRAGRWAVQWVIALANVCPVAIVRGTISHDRDTPDLFGNLKSVYPIYVSSKMEVVSLHSAQQGVCFKEGLMPPPYSDTKAVLTFIPSPNKAHVIVNQDNDSIQATNMIASEMLHDAMAALGSVNAQVPAGIPKILLAHGMITGSKMSGGFEMVGDDFEFSVTDIQLTNTDYKAFGHVHGEQEFIDNIHYSGSIARLDFGEKEDKGFKQVTFNGNEVESVEFIQTPARRFEFFEYGWENGVEGFHNEFDTFCGGPISGAVVRVRVKVPEEERHHIDRDMIADKLTDLLGAVNVKVEVSIIPKVRQRAEGISQMDDLPAKVKKWGDVVGQVVPERVLDIARSIEGESLDCLISSAKSNMAPTELSVEQ